MRQHFRKAIELLARAVDPRTDQRGNHVAHRRPGRRVAKEVDDVVDGVPMGLVKRQQI